MAFDFKKEYKEFYLPKDTPQIVTVPKANYVAVRGKGNPNEEGGEYKQAVGVEGCDYTRKEEFHWISLIRLPDFVTEKDFDWAVQTATAKKKMDCSKAEFLTVDEGLCVQIMHHGPFDDEPATIEIMKKYITENGYAFDLSETRRHHEIYLSDPRKCSPDKNRCVIRYPVKKKG